MSYLEIKNLTKKYKDNVVLKGIDLSINKGEVVSIIGSSGSGKTTLLRCVNFLETVDNGTMILDNETLLDSTIQDKDNEKILRQKRLNFGLVFQSFNLFPQYSVIKNITLAPSLLLATKLKEMKRDLLKERTLTRKKLKNDLSKDKTLTRKDIKNKLNEYKAQEKELIEKDGEDLLKKVGLIDKRNSYPCELSGGQCQRVAIARALALKPKILCFDEPTSALDPELTGEVLKVIKSLKAKDRTMIIVTHEMGFAKNVSDKVVFMADGVIEEAGTPAEIFDNPKSIKLKNFLSHINNKDGE